MLSSLYSLSFNYSITLVSVTGEQVEYEMHTLYFLTMRNVDHENILSSRMAFLFD